MIDLFSQTSYFLEVRFNDELLSTATCFFVRRDNELFLLTNWHVVTGLNSQNRECLDEHGRIPNKLSAHIFTDEEYINWSEFEIELYTEDEKPVWLEHPLHKRIVDVIAIKVTIPENQIVTPLEEMIEPFNENTEIRISEDVFILGFPFSIKYGGNFPIWKRASIASEPSVDIDELPITLALGLLTHRRRHKSVLLPQTYRDAA